MIRVSRYYKSTIKSTRCCLTVTSSVHCVIVIVATCPLNLLVVCNAIGHLLAVVTLFQAVPSIDNIAVHASFFFFYDFVSLYADV